MNLFDYNDPDLQLFYKLGAHAVQLSTANIIKIPYSNYETSTGPEELDFPFDLQTVTLRPGFWYALNLSVNGEKRKKLIESAQTIRNQMKEQFGQYEISFIIVLPSKGHIPWHRHFRENNTVTFCIPSKDNDQGLQIKVENETVIIKNGYINFDSKAYHEATNLSDETYWIFVFENVRAKENPRLRTVEL